MGKLIHYFINNPVLVNLCGLLIILLGLIGLSQTRYTIDPEQKLGIVFVDITYRGASPAEVEEQILVRIEDNLRGISEIDRYSSIAREHGGQIRVELHDGADIDDGLSQVEQAVSRISSFPSDMDPIVVRKKEWLTRTAILALTGDFPLQELKDHAQKIRDDLLQDGGLSTVVIHGLPDEEIGIHVDEQTLDKYHLTFDEIISAIRQSNLNIAGGEIKTGEANWQIRSNHQNNTAFDLLNTPIRTGKDQSVLRLGEVAEVKDRFAEQSNYRYLNGERSVAIEIFTKGDEDLLKAVDYIKEYMTDFGQRYTGVELKLIEDWSEFLHERVSSMRNNAIAGLFLVLLVLTLFLNKRLALWVAITIPLSIFGVFILSGISAGFSINVVSIFGFILVLGMLVDTAVVVSENIYQHCIERDKKPVQAAIDGTLEVFTPLLISLLTTIVAFSLFFFLPGQAGVYFSQISFVVIASLLVALILSFFLLPQKLANSRALKKSNEHTGPVKKINNLIFAIRDNWFLPFFFNVLTRWKKWTALVFLFLLCTVFLLIRFGLVNVTFFPDLSDDILLVTLEMPPGTPAHETDRELKNIEEIAWDLNQEYTSTDAVLVRHIERIIGPDSHQGRLRVILTGGEERGVSSHELNQHLREQVGVLEGANILRFSGEVAERRFGGLPVSISLIGINIEEIRSAAADLKIKMQERKDLVDVIDTDNMGIPELHLQLSVVGEQLGLTNAGIMHQVRTGFFGTEIQNVSRGMDDIRIWLRYKETGRSSINQLKEMKIRTQDEGSFPLEEVADITPENAWLEINRLNGQRQIRVDADLARPGLSPPAIISDLESEVLPTILSNYPGVDYSIEGQQRESDLILSVMKVVGPVVLLFMLSLIVISFRSFSQMFIVLTSLPFALIGVVLGHFIHQQPLNIFSLIGVIALIGILVNNKLVLITAFNDNIVSGSSFTESIINAVQSRFRPIILTTVSTVAGLAPMIFLGGLASAFLRPPAISIAYGLIFGLVITLILIPLIMIASNKMKCSILKAFKSEDVLPESVEPAVQLMKYREEIKKG